MTDPKPTGAPIGEDDLQAWVDRQLPAERAALVRAYLDAHPDQAARLNRYGAQGQDLAAALRGKFDEPVPARLRTDAVLARRRRHLSGHLARAAAVVLVAGLGAAGGWIGHGWASRDRLQAATASAVAAYQTFTVEARHPVEVRAEEGLHLVQWLSNRLARPLTPPDLAPFGFRLMGGRVLPAAGVPAGGVPAALLMYDDGQGARLTVYVQPMGIDGEEFRYTQQGDVRTIIWAERHMALAVTGQVPQAGLMAVARRVRDEMARGAAP